MRPKGKGRHFLGKCVKAPTQGQKELEPRLVLREVAAADKLTNTPAFAASAQAVDTVSIVPSSSQKWTQSRFQVCWTATKANSRLDHGRNGRATRTVWCSAAGVGVVDGAGQRRRGKLVLDPKERSRPPLLPNAVRRTQTRNIPLRTRQGQVFDWPFCQSNAGQREARMDVIVRVRHRYGFRSKPGVVDSAAVMVHGGSSN